MTTPPTTDNRSDTIAQERSPKVTDLRAPAFDKDRASSLLGLAKGAVRRGEHTLASRLFSRALEKTPDDVEAIIGLAASELMLGHGAAAEELALRALQLAPASPDARLVLANLRIAQDRHRDAIEHLRDAIAVAPNFAIGLSRLGTILTALGEYTAAEPILLRALALDPVDADALNSIGNLVLSKGDLSRAALHFQRAVAANPGWLKPRMNLAATLEKLNRFDDAIDALEGILTQDPRQTEARVYLGGLLHRTGDLRRAKYVLDEALEAEPENLGALFLTGLVHMQLRQAEDATPYFERAAKLAPASSEVLANLAYAYRDADRLADALLVAQQAVNQNGDDAVALNALGSVLLNCDRASEAAAVFRKVIDSNPTLHSAYVNLAMALLAQDRGVDAIEPLERARALGASPEIVDHSLGLAFRDAGNLAKSETHLLRAIEHDPNDARALYALGAVLEMQGRRRDAGPIAGRLLAQDPSLVHAHVVKALAAESAVDGLASAAKALAIDPDDLDALLVSGTLSDTANRPADALRFYEAALAIQPDHAKARSRRADIVLSLCDFERREALVQETLASLRDTGALEGVDVFNLQALDVGYSEIAGAAKAASASLVRRLEAKDGELWVPRVTSGAKRIRIGYLLPYTWFHSLPMVLRRIVEAHDRNNFEVVGFTTQVGSKPDDFERAYKAAFDEFHPLVGLSPRQAASKIGAAGIDILIEVSGHTSISCLPIAAYRPAPIQVHLLGYSITTGAPFIDYLITDEIYIPRDQAALGTEHVVYMPHSFMPALPQRIADGTVRRAELNLPNDAFVLANFNHPCKFEPEIFAAWMAIMKRVPKAVLWLGHWFEETATNLRREAERHGVSGNRLIFAPIMEHADHLRRLSQADLALDNRLHGGGITTIDALWAGLPLLSIRGETPSSRLGATLLHGIDMDDMIAPTLETYIDRAVTLAEDPGALAALRDRLAKNRAMSPLFDFNAYVHDLERAYSAIWARHTSGAPPDLIDLKAGA
ncbi:MAG: tetratricopeptide repeat protein [Alphaproteobacteria bacterium]